MMLDMMIRSIPSYITSTLLVQVRSGGEIVLPTPWHRLQWITSGTTVD